MKGSFKLITINSVLLYLLAYILMFVVTRLSASIAASAFNIPSTIYYYDIDFLITSHDWSADAVNTIFSASPLISFILALGLFALYREIISFSGISGIFIAWLFLAFFGYFAGELIVGSILNKGFGYVLMYMFVMDTGRLALTVLAGLAILMAGRAIARTLLYSGNIYFNDLKDIYKLKYAIYQFILPFIIGTAILQICEIPNFSIYLFLSRLSLILIFLPLIPRSMSIPDLYFEEDTKTPAFSKTLLIITILALIAYRVVFGIGLRLF